MVAEWQIEGPELSSVAGAELRPLGEEERNVRPDRGGDRAQPVWRQRLREGFVGEPERRCRVRAAAGQPGRDRDALVDPHRPARLDARRGGELLERAGDERVVLEA